MGKIVVGREGEVLVWGVLLMDISVLGREGEEGVVWLSRPPDVFTSRRLDFQKARHIDG